MRALLDACVSRRVRAALERSGHDVISVRDWGEDPGDENILARAHAEGRVLITLDKDFGEIAVLWGQPHSGIVRLSDLLLIEQQEAACLRALERYGAELQAGAIVTAEPGRLRIRPPG